MKRILSKNLEKALNERFPSLFKRVYIGKGSPPPTLIPPVERDKLVRWQNRVKFELPEIYNEYLEKGDNLAAFIIVTNLLEYHLKYKIFEVSYLRSSPEGTEFFKKLRHTPLLPSSVINLLMFVYMKFMLIYTPDFFDKYDYTLGELIGLVKKLKMEKDFVDKLGKFNGIRKMLIHKLCNMEHIDNDIKEDSKKACDLANEIWEQLKPDINIISFNSP